MSTPVVHWILYPTKKRYHAWRHGERESACGTLTVAHLKERAAADVVERLGEDQVPCGTCARIVGLGKLTGTASAAWLGFIVRHLKHKHCTAPRQDLEAVAELLVETGPPDDPAALELFEQVKVLLLTPMRIRTGTGKEYRRIVGLREALALLTPNTGKLAAVAAAFRCWRNAMGRTDPGNFRADKVIRVMLQIPEPELYLNYLKARGLEPLGVAFHENVLARAKKEPELRGLFGGSSEYWKRTADQLRIITE